MKAYLTLTVFTNVTLCGDVILSEAKDRRPGCCHADRIVGCPDSSLALGMTPSP
jgi:hypothetical protein